MCTVTCIPVNGRYCITSNRDEKNTRPAALSPAIYEINGKKLVYPKDTKAGGTWIALHENGNAAILLNGAFEPHIPQPCYRRSRGMIVLEIISSETPALHFQQLNLLDIEPFTLVLLEQDDLYEYRWDGEKKHGRKLQQHQPYIWSSVTLYDREGMHKREQWLSAFLTHTPDPTQEDILKFHQWQGNEDPANSLLMQRGNGHLTVSITSILLTGSKARMTYLDLHNKTRHETKLELQGSFEAQ